MSAKFPRGGGANPFSAIRLYPTELHLIRRILLILKPPFLTWIYDKWDDFNFDLVNFPFLDKDVPRSASYGVSISQLIRFASVCYIFEDYNNRNLFLLLSY